MDTLRAKFKFASEAGVDSRSTVVKVKTIRLEDHPEVYIFAPNQQTTEHHTQLFNTKIATNVVKSLKIRNKFRNVMITLSTELAAVYLDDENNVIFNDVYLDEVIQEEKTNRSLTMEKSTRLLAKDMVLEKFNGENGDANVWLKVFIQECTRVGISDDKYTETLRLFLDKSALDWYNIFSKTNLLSSNWELWNNSFLDTFAVQSWSDIAYALNFKYLNGSLLEFAPKKRRLLLETDENMSLFTQMNLLVISLPKTIQNTKENSLDDKIEIENQIEKLLDADLIKESYSPYAAPVLLVFKKEENKKFRLCVDYKDLNKLVVPECQPFPRIEDLTVKAGKCKNFTTLDINSAFWSIPLRKKDRYKLAFVTHHGHWQ